MPRIANRVASLGTTIFTEINELAAQYNAVNLGQGRPDFDAHPDIIAALKQAADGGAQYNQYAPGSGTLSLRQGVANHVRDFYDLDIDPASGVIVTSGATEGIFSALIGLVDAGDEVIVIEPFFDSYVPNIEWLGAKPVFVPLYPPTWTFNPDELRAAFTPKTRAIIINSPHNPTGRVFTYEEQKLIAELCIEHDVICISDEVYEHLVYEGYQHIPMCTMPGMFDRTVTVISMGKTYSVTGWKLGWVYGHPDLIAGVARAHQFVTFASHHPAQEAAAVALALPQSYYDDFQRLYAGKRDILYNGLVSAGFKTAPPEGTFFILGDFSDLYTGDAPDFARYLISEIGVSTIPLTPFYSPQHAHLASKQARFAFCKSDDTLHEASKRLQKLTKIAR